jgi:hypothetical protein
MNTIKNKASQLFAIHRDGLHVGNVRETSTIKAVEVYLLDSGYSELDLLDTTLISKYKVIIAKKNVHYLSFSQI